MFLLPVSCGADLNKVSVLKWNMHERDTEMETVTLPLVTKDLVKVVFAFFLVFHFLTFFDECIFIVPASFYKINYPIYSFNLVPHNAHFLPDHIYLATRKWQVKEMHTNFFLWSQQSMSLFQSQFPFVNKRGATLKMFPQNSMSMWKRSNHSRDWRRWTFYTCWGEIKNFTPKTRGETWYQGENVWVWGITIMDGSHLGHFL
jgi:hypothetical protein